MCKIDQLRPGVVFSDKPEIKSDDSPAYLVLSINNYEFANKIAHLTISLLGTMNKFINEMNNQPVYSDVFSNPFKVKMPLSDITISGKVINIPYKEEDIKNIIAKSENEMFSKIIENSVVIQDDNNTAEDFCKEVTSFASCYDFKKEERDEWINNHKEITKKIESSWLYLQSKIDNDRKIAFASKVKMQNKPLEHHRDSYKNIFLEATLNNYYSAIHFIRAYRILGFKDLAEVYSISEDDARTLVKDIISKYKYKKK